MFHPSRFGATTFARRPPLQLIRSDSPARTRVEPTDEEPLEVDLLADIAAGLAATISAEVVPSGAERRWTRLLVTRRYEAWLIAWPSGTGLALHDHGGAAGVLHVVAGVLEETFLDGRARRLEPGDVAAFGPAHVHGVRNDRREEALSVHVYSPPLREINSHTAGAVVLPLRAER
ncbi:MAG TPA: cysteine dioxygenase family protein [Acidimicrobiales bacterium]|jgi:quercetin dioxygenase-like cupin family protein|nr:cysteine dioxygenase family protein [Acidimicrobiales bacterium]